MLILIYYGLTSVLGVAAACSVLYLLTLLTAATASNRDRLRLAQVVDTAQGLNGAETLRLTVVIPAHDEEPVIAATLVSLQAQEYPANLFQIVVVADNCTDATAEVARSYGVTVLERVNLAERGKGYALAWAFSHLLSLSDRVDGYVIVDADTSVAPDFLRSMAARMQKQMDARGYCALQGRYGVLNSGDSWRASLMAAALDLFNHVRPLGADRLRLNVGLKGNGMAFTRALLEHAHWRGDSITEDIDFGLDLLREHGVRAGYVPEALVRAQMPATANQAASQRARWEGGRYRLLRQRFFPLLAEGIRRRNLSLCDAAFSLLLPPLAELAALLASWGVLIAVGCAFHWLPGARIWMGFWTLSALGLITYVLGGLHTAGAPREAYPALLKAPFYAVWKLALYAASFGKRLRRSGRAGSRQPAEWVRTQRLPIPGAGTLESVVELSPVSPVGTQEVA